MRAPTCDSLVAKIRHRCRMSFFVHSVICWKNCLRKRVIRDYNQKRSMSAIDSITTLKSSRETKRRKCLELLADKGNLEKKERCGEVLDQSTLPAIPQTVTGQVNHTSIGKSSARSAMNNYGDDFNATIPQKY